MKLYEDESNLIGEEFKLGKRLTEEFSFLPCPNGCGYVHVKKVGAVVIPKSDNGQRIVEEHFFCGECHDLFDIRIWTEIDSAVCEHELQLAA